MHNALKLDEATLSQFCRKHHIRRLSLFGSQLKGSAGPDSDIDLLVEFEPVHAPTLCEIAGMAIESAARQALPVQREMMLRRP